MTPLHILWYQLFLYVSNWTRRMCREWAHTYILECLRGALVYLAWSRNGQSKWWPICWDYGWLCMLHKNSWKAIQRITDIEVFAKKNTIAITLISLGVTGQTTKNSLFFWTSNCQHIISTWKVNVLHRISFD